MGKSGENRNERVNEEYGRQGKYAKRNKEVHAKNENKKDK
ncbi:hypothetical protein B0H94_11523 [Salsuginibacillus halophilus]|uniref:Uncharacterized protein n=1 Tax=Salsuginibacillus halophilus TaxID=517424 RepID=A0A2P8H8A7_9BACI|nr:hypothetical protein B0H94_11523 [Salsuginibacillus halophilus]